jgi:hypothetical protein
MAASETTQSVSTATPFKPASAQIAQGLVGLLLQDGGPRLMCCGSQAYDPQAQGIDSPVTMDSSTALLPSSTVPSTGTPSPGRIRSRSPSFTWSRLISSSPPPLTQAPRGLWGEVQQRTDERLAGRKVFFSEEKKQKTFYRCR